DPMNICFALEGYRSLRVDRSGDLVVETDAGEVRHSAPVVYQAGAKGREFRSGGFELRDGGRVGFRIGAYDRTRELVIDPTLAYAVGFGGKSQFGPFGGYFLRRADGATRLGRDRFGNFFLAGIAYSDDFPSVNALQEARFGGGSIFISKLSA